MKHVLKSLIFTALLTVMLFAFTMGVGSIPSREPGITDTINVPLKDIITRVMPSVVFIKGYIGEYGRPFTGSGFIVNDDTIMTAGHCIPDDLTKMEVFTVTGRQFLARKWRRDYDLDCGIVSVWGDLPDGTACEVAKYGDYSVGDYCFTIGNPYGLPFVVTKGIVSAIGISIPMFGEPLIMIDAVANPGCSGGPVFNMDGKVIGIVVGTFSYLGNGTVVVPILSAIEELNDGR